MLIATLAAAAASLAVAPPAPPSAPPAPPLAVASDDGSQVVTTRTADGRRVILVTRRGPSADGAPGVVSYRASDGAEVTVVSERPVTEAEAERLRADARSHAIRAGADALAQAGLSRDRVQEIARQARAQAAQALAQAGESRDYAELVRRALRQARAGLDGADLSDAPSGAGAGAGPGPQRAQIEALTAQMAELRHELDAMRRELDRAVGDSAGH